MEVLGALAIAAAAALYVWYVHRYGVNVPFEDEWHMVTLLLSVHQGRLDLAMLWAQHNENRMLFAFLLLLGLELTSHFDTVVEMYASAALLLLGLLVLLRLYRINTKAGVWGFVPAALVLLSLAQSAVTLQGFALAIFMIVICLPLALWLLEQGRRRPWLLGWAALVALIGSFSSIQGLAIWPAGIVYLTARGQPPVRTYAWTGLGLLTSALYLVGFNWSLAGGGGFRSALAHPLTSLHYLALLAGSAIPQSRVLHLDLRVLSLLGVLILAGVVAVFAYWLISRPAPDLALALALIGFAVVIDVLNTLGRGSYGVSYASSSRYVVFNLWLLAGLWLGALQIWRRHRPRGDILPALAMGAVGLLLVAQIGLSLHAGLVAGRTLRQQREEGASLVLDYRHAPPPLVYTYLYPTYSVFEQRAQELQRLHLSVFFGRR